MTLLLSSSRYYQGHQNNSNFDSKLVNDFQDCWWYFCKYLELEKKYFSLRTITHRNDHIKHQPTYSCKSNNKMRSPQLLDTKLRDLHPLCKPISRFYYSTSLVTHVCEIRKDVRNKTSVCCKKFLIKVRRVWPIYHVKLRL